MHSKSSKSENIVMSEVQKRCVKVGRRRRRRVRMGRVRCVREGESKNESRTTLTYACVGRRGRVRMGRLRCVCVFGRERVRMRVGLR